MLKYFSVFFSPLLLFGSELGDDISVLHMSFLSTESQIVHGRVLSYKEESWASVVYNNHLKNFKALASPLVQTTFSS